MFNLKYASGIVYNNDVIEKLKKIALEKKQKD